MEINLNGIRLRYEEAGAGPALLLLHAFPLSGAMWRQQVGALQGQHRLIAPDLRGFGGSDAPPDTYTMDEYADDMAALLDRLGLAQAAVCGISMGGYIAMAFLRRHAARASALVLADTKAAADSGEARAGRESNARLAETQGAAALAEKLIPGLVSSAAPQSLRNELRAMIAANPPTGIAGALRGMALRPDATPYLGAIDVPTLVIVGVEDGLTPPAEAAALQARIPGSQLLEIPAAGHLSSMEAPAAFSTALQMFLGGAQV
jgi:pimeloyl-ACP methyl ester carboxylesterase